jgi:hypothetical protein
MGILRTDKISGLETPTAVTGSVVFDGTGDYVTSSAFHIAGSWTMEFWFNTSVNDSTQRPMNFSNNLNASNYAYIELGSSGNIKARVAGAAAFGSIDAPPVNQWHHTALSYDGSKAYFLLNGKLIASQSVSYSNHSIRVRFGADESNASSNLYTGYVSNARIVSGEALYTTDYTVPIHAFEVTDGTNLLCFNNADSATASEHGRIGADPPTLTVTGDAAGSTVSPGLTRDFTSGTEFKGVTTFDTQGYFVPPSGTTTDRNRTGGRLLWGGGHNPSPGKTTAIGYVTISSLGNSRDFGDLTLARRQLTGASSSTRGVFIGGDSSPTDAADDLMDYVTIASTGNAVFFGNLQAPGKQTPQGCSNGIRGISYGGGEPHTDQIDVFTIASLGNATDFGNADVAGRGGAATESSTRALLAGGVGPADLNRIEYITMATNGDGQDFGDLADGRRNIAGTSDGVRAVFAGGFTSPGGPSLNTLDYVTIATFGNSQDFGDLTVNRSNPGNGSSSNKIRGLFVGGNDSPAGSVSNSIDYITIATTGNAKDFGDAGSKGELTQTGLLTDSHGGIS